MNIDMNRIIVFHAVFTRRGISNAAETLHITPSAVSQQIKRLEKELNFPLFTRQKKRLIPTASGHKLFKLVSPLITGLKEGLEQIDQEQHEPSGLIRIGSAFEFGCTYIPKFIASFRSRYPKVVFDMKLGPTSELLNLIGRGEIDFGFVDDYPMPPGNTHLEEFKITPLLEEMVVLVCSGKYLEEVLENDLSYERLKKADYVTQQYGGPSLRLWFQHHFSENPKDLNIVLNAANNQAIISSIKNHLGLGVSVSHLIQKEIESGEIAIIREKENQPSNNISLIKLLNKYDPIREVKFLQHVQRHIQKIRPFSKKYPKGYLGLRHIDTTELIND